MRASRSASCICMIFCARAWRRFGPLNVIARSAATKQSRPPLRCEMDCFASLAMTGLDLCRKSRCFLLQRQCQSVREIRYGAIESAQHYDLQNLRLVVMCREASELDLAQRCALMQRVDGRYQRLLGVRPAVLRGSTAHRGADLFFA